MTAMGAEYKCDECGHMVNENEPHSCPGVNMDQVRWAIREAVAEAILEERKRMAAALRRAAERFVQPEKGNDAYYLQPHVMQPPGLALMAVAEEIEKEDDDDTNDRE
jgi:hypothetical protein